MVALTLEEPRDNVRGESIGILDHKRFTVGGPTRQAPAARSITITDHFQRFPQENGLLLTGAAAVLEAGAAARRRARGVLATCGHSLKCMCIRMFPYVSLLVRQFLVCVPMYNRALGQLVRACACLLLCAVMSEVG